MACLNTWEQHGIYAYPRISFSSDFGDTMNQETNYREAPASSDFEFSLRNFNIVPADKIFSEGMLVPLKENSAIPPRKMTLREELLASGDDEFKPTQHKSLGRWKERFGLKRSHVVSKKEEMEKIVEENSVQYEGVNERKRLFRGPGPLTWQRIGSL